MTILGHKIFNLQVIIEIRILLYLITPGKIITNIPFLFPIWILAFDNLLWPFLFLRIFDAYRVWVIISILPGPFLYELFETRFGN
jgi:hypothetical protein